MAYFTLSLFVSLSASLLLSHCQSKAPETQVPSSVEGESARFEGLPSTEPVDSPSYPPRAEPIEEQVDQPTENSESSEDSTEYPGLPTSNNPRFNKPRGN